jgi:hypothetical protein
VALPLLCSYCNGSDEGFSAGSGSITRASDGRYLVAGQLQQAGNDSMAVAYYKYNSGFAPDTNIGDQSNNIVNIPVSTALTNPTGVGLHAVYTPDGLRIVVVGRMLLGKNTDGKAVEHFVVARIWNSGIFVGGGPYGRPNALRLCCKHPLPVKGRSSCCSMR